MAKRKRRTFTAGFKRKALRLRKVGDRTLGQVAADLDWTETALRAWVRNAGAVRPAAIPASLSRCFRLTTLAKRDVPRTDVS